MSIYFGPNAFSLIAIRDSRFSVERVHASHALKRILSALLSIPRPIDATAVVVTAARRVVLGVRL